MTLHHCMRRFFTYCWEKKLPPPTIPMDPNNHNYNMQKILNTNPCQICQFGNSDSLKVLVPLVLGLYTEVKSYGHLLYKRIVNPRLVLEVNWANIWSFWTSDKMGLRKLQFHMIDITVLELLGHEAHNEGLEAAKVQLIKKKTVWRRQPIPAILA